MPTAKLRTLGAFEFSVDGRAMARPSTQKARALLAYLAMHGETSNARDELVETFWPDAPPNNARQSLKTALWSIRRAIREGGADPKDLLTADHATVRWIAPTWVDACEFDARAHSGDCDALELYRGEFLPGDYDVWPSAQRERLSTSLEMLLSKSLERKGDVAAARRLLQLDPFSEAAYTTLIDAELGAARIGSARAMLGCFREVLRENRLSASETFDARFARLEAQPIVAPAPARFIGRARELHRFEECLHGEAPVTLVVRGDAGLGKTTLLERFVRRAADANRPTVLVTVAREASGFGGWERVYQNLVGEPLASLLAERGASLASALAQAIVRALPRGAFIFVDDAQHLQGDSRFVTGAIHDMAREKGISVVFATRPEGAGRVFDLIGATDVLEMQLQAFTEDELRAALAQAGGAEGAFVSTLFARTRGHPLYLHRVLERVYDGEPQFDLPESVRVLIENRLRERGEDPHAIAALLALDGRFGADELAAILEWPEERVLDALDDLLALGIVHESNVAGHLAFTHDVVGEVARESLSAARRRRLHRIAAHRLESATRLSDLARAAEHTAAAGDGLTAAQLYLRCALAATAAFEPRNAAVLAEHAREQLRALERTDEVERLSLRIDAAEIKAHNAAANPAKAEALATAAIATARALGDPRVLFEMVLLRLRARMRTSAIADIVEDARDAMELATDLGDRSCFAQAALGVLQASMQHVNEAEAMKYGQLALDAAIESGDADLATFVASECLHAQAIFWRFEEAIATLGRGEALLRAGSGATAPSLYYSAAQLMYVLERYEEASRFIDVALRLLDERRPAPGPFISDRLRIIAILTNLRGLIAVARGRWDEACAAADAFAANPAAQNSGVYPHVVDLGVRALLGRGGEGDVEKAAELLGRVDPAALVDDTRMYMACAGARLAARRRDPRAPALLDEAIVRTLETAEKAGLDADTLLDGLASAAMEAGAAEQAERAAQLRDRYRARRVAAAGPHWGGEPAS